VERKKKAINRWEVLSDPTGRSPEGKGPTAPQNAWGPQGEVVARTGVLTEVSRPRGGANEAGHGAREFHDRPKWRKNMLHMTGSQGNKQLKELKK